MNIDLTGSGDENSQGDSQGSTGSSVTCTGTYHAGAAASSKYPDSEDSDASVSMLPTASEGTTAKEIKLRIGLFSKTQVDATGGPKFPETEHHKGDIQRRQRFKKGSSMLPRYKWDSYAYRGKGVFPPKTAATIIAGPAKSGAPAEGQPHAVSLPRSARNDAILTAVRSTVAARVGGGGGRQGGGWC